MNDVTHTETPIESISVESWHAESDVLIVGGGGAGISAAIEAAEFRDYLPPAGIVPDYRAAPKAIPVA